MGSYAHIVLATVTVGAMGCAHELTDTFTGETYVQERWLPALEDGATSRGEIVAALGEPSRSFQSGTVLAYRLLLVEANKALDRREYLSLVFTPFGSSIAGTERRRKALSVNGTLAVARDDGKEEQLLLVLSREAEYSLVLVFDDHGTLRQHRLLRVLP